MPRAPSVCTTTGCTSPAPPGRSRCDPHRREYNATVDSRRPTAAARGYDRKWQATRAAYLNTHPMCEDGCGQPATDVDHIDGLGPNGPHGHDWSNLRALAHACHGRRTARDQPGGWNKRTA